MKADSFRMNPVSLCALIGAVVAFLAADAIEAVLWVALGAVVGGMVGIGIQRFGQRARSYADAAEREAELDDLSRDQLYRRAKRLAIDGRSNMSRGELVHAIAERDAQGA
jgi:hypothetical protein